jgi:cholesterol oxidase
MGRDCPDGRLFLSDEYLDCDWSVKGSQDYYDRVERELHRIAEALNAKYEDNPAFRWNFHQVLTAHPLGGCPMGKDERDGVVNACGEVFNYPNLFVADGSVMPGPVGPNPSLTIAALADRFAEHIIARHKGEKHECDTYGK